MNPNFISIQKWRCGTLFFTRDSRKSKWLFLSEIYGRAHLIRLGKRIDLSPLIDPTAPFLDLSESFKGSLKWPFKKPQRGSQRGCQKSNGVAFQPCAGVPPPSRHYGLVQLTISHYRWKWNQLMNSITLDVLLHIDKVKK